ncbi:MAG: adenosylcobinamide-GDP ribazoletransferase [Litorimonas sp.]
MRGEIATFLLAVQFLTRIPVDSRTLFTPERMAASVRYYPLVGVLVGGFAALIFLIAASVLPVVVAVLLSTAGGLLLTGAFHEDGLADTFDGIGGGLTRQTALEIMRDSRLGTYGTLALVAALALKVAALSAMSPMLIAGALVAGHSLSRLSSVAVIATSRYVRDEGTGKPVAGGISRTSLVAASGTSLLVMAVWLAVLPAPALLCALLGLLAGHGAMRLFFERKLGGYTGDTLGAVQQASEAGFYLGLLAWL